jgi:hypothetical protein
MSLVSLDATLTSLAFRSFVYRGNLSASLDYNAVLDVYRRIRIVLESGGSARELRMAIDHLRGLNSFGRD